MKFMNFFNFDLKNLILIWKFKVQNGILSI